MPPLRRQNRIAISPPLLNLIHRQKHKTVSHCGHSTIRGRSDSKAQSRRCRAYSTSPHSRFHQFGRYSNLALSGLRPRLCNTYCKECQFPYADPEQECRLPYNGRRAPSHDSHVHTNPILFHALVRNIKQRTERPSFDIEVSCSVEFYRKSHEGTTAAGMPCAPIEEPLAYESITAP